MTVPAEYGFQATDRLKTPRDFSLCYGRGVRVKGRDLFLVVRRNGTATCRLGLSVSRKFGNSPRRNRFKRICREAFRLNHRHFPAGLDIVVIGARTKDAPIPTLADAGREMRKLADKAETRLADRAASRRRKGR